jgi:hypothetical protein
VERNRAFIPALIELTSGEILCETASCVLLESIRWLYLVPSFKNLDERDQFLLIEQSWSNLFLLASAEMKKFLGQSRPRGRKSHSTVIRLGEHDCLKEDNHYAWFQAIVKELIRHAMDSTEYTLLKLILLFTARK